MQINGAVKFRSKRDADPDLPLPEDFLDPAEAGKVLAPPGRVIVVGAGPAGLAAACHLKVKL